MPSGVIYKRGDVWHLCIHTGRRVSGRYERIRRRADGTTKNEAQLDLDNELYRLRRAAAAGGAVNNRYPFDDLITKCSEHIDRVMTNQETASQYKQSLHRICSQLNVEMVSDLTVELVEIAAHKIAEELSTNSANKSLARLQRAIQYGIDNGWLASNPIEKAKRLRPVRKKFRRDLSHEEVAALLSVASPTYRPIWFALVCTGARANELMSLRVEDVNTKQRFVRIREAPDKSVKTQTSVRTIPVNAELACMLKDMMPDHGYVFGTKDGKKRQNNLWRNFKRHMRRALLHLKWKPEDAMRELALLDIHSLRYTFITELIDSGVNPKAVQQLAGHRDIATTLGIYAQCRQGSVDKAVAALPWSLKSSPQIRHKNAPKSSITKNESHK